MRRIDLWSEKGRSDRRPSPVRATFVVTLLMVTAVLVGPADPVRAQTQADVQRMLALSNAHDKFKAAGRWDLVAQACEEMLALSRASGMPASIEVAAIDQLALARLNLGEYSEALKLYEQVLEGCQRIRVSPADEAQRRGVLVFNGLTGLGRVHRLVAHQEKAADYFRQAMKYANRVGLTDEAARSSTDLALSLTELDRTDEAIQTLKPTLPILKRSVDFRRGADVANTSYSNALHAMAYAYDHAGRYDLGEPYHREALDVIVRSVGWKHNFTANVVDNLANSYHMQGRADEAEQLYRTAITIYEATIGRDHPRCAVALNNLARLLETEKGEHAEAEKMSREALAIKRKFYGDEHQEVAISTLNLANILSYQDRDAESEVLTREALAIFQKARGQYDAQTIQCLQLLSTCRVKQGAADEALAIIDSALEAAQQVALTADQAAKLHASRAVPLQLLGRVKDATEELDRALEFVEVQRTYAAGVERERAGVFEQNAVLYDLNVSNQADLGNVEAMFAVSESMKARSFLDELQTQHLDFTAELPEARRKELAAEEARARRELSAAQAAFDALPNFGPQPTAEQLAQMKKLAAAVYAARDALYDHLAKVKAASKTYHDLITNQEKTASLSDLQQALADGELVLSYWVGESHSYAIAIRHDRAEFCELTLSEPAAELLGVEPGALTREKLATALLASEGGVMAALSSPESSTDVLLDKLAALWLTVIPADERERLVDGSVKRLTILPAGALALLPFEALVVTHDEHPEYLLDVGPPVFYAPSASVLLNLARRDDMLPKAQTPVLTLGDPAYPQPGEKADVVDRLMEAAGSRTTRAALSRLPYSGWEAKWVKQHFEEAGVQAALLSGAQATEAALRRNIAGHQIVHLACHGLAEQAYGNFFGELALAPGRAGDPNDDGTLSMSEIYDLPLDGCELAVLSACQTNYGPEQRGEGVWALSRGFLVAGARRVLASNWVVSDQAGATLVSYFTSYLTKSRSDDTRSQSDDTRSQSDDGYDYADALRQAKRAVRQDERWAHPFYWSSLVLVGPK